MRNLSRRNLYRAGLAILAGCVLCLVANVLMVVLIKGELLFDAARPAKKELSAELLQELRLEGNAIERSLLIDSILSIVQSYYVDNERVKNKVLFEGAVEALSTHPDISSKRNGEQIKVTVGKTSHTFNLSGEPTYRQTLKELLTLASMVDKHLGHQGEKNQWHSRPDVIIVNSLLSALDAHSALLSPEAYRELRQGTEGSFGGLGVLVGIRDQVLTVIKPLPHSPALRAGVQRQDRILSIDGYATFGFGLDELVEYMRGDPGTAVKLMVLRDGDSHPQLVKLTREIIKVESVETAVIAENDLNILHMKIENFSSRTSEEVANALVKHRNTFGLIDGVVIDLRSNPGGLLDQAVAVSNIFLEKGVILTTKGRRSEVESANSHINEIDFPVMILINGDSASASEIVAGALQDHGRAVVIGQPSFGKGSVQTIFELPNEQALKLTIARYYTPLGRSIQNVGITPDIWTQPILKRPENMNLMGAVRYKNERYLPNRLEAEASGLDASLANRLRNFKSYYLIDKESDIYDLKRDVDVELNVAKLIVAAVRRHYEEKVEAGGLRAGHWLALGAPELKRYLQDQTAMTTEWLGQAHKVDWSIANNVGDNKVGAGLALETTAQEVVPAKIGSVLNLPWSIANMGSQDIGRVSIFVNSGSAAFETQEHLVGFVKAGSTESGLFKVKVPSYLKEGHLRINIGFAIDARPVIGGAIQRTLLLRPMKAAAIETFVSLSNEQGGQVKGTLEAGETAKLKITVTNQSDFDAKQVRATIVNLSGAQIDLGSDSSEISVLPRKKQRTMYIDIKGAERLYNTELQLGLTIESDDLPEPLLRNVTLSSHPNFVDGKGVSSFSH